MVAGITPILVMRFAGFGLFFASKLKKLQKILLIRINRLGGDLSSVCGVCALTLLAKPFDKGSWWAACIATET